MEGEIVGILDRQSIKWGEKTRFLLVVKGGVACEREE